MAHTCRTCIWWKPAEQQPMKGKLGLQWGDCRRQSPRLQLARYSDERSSAWPPTSVDDWCGEHRPELQSTLPLEASNG